jgi:hypothetical protein
MSPLMKVTISGYSLKKSANTHYSPLFGRLILTTHSNKTYVLNQYYTSII